MKTILTTVALTTTLLAGSNFAADNDDSMSMQMGEFDEQRMQMHLSLIHI